MFYELKAVKYRVPNAEKYGLGRGSLPAQMTITLISAKLRDLIARPSTAYETRFQSLYFAVENFFD